MRFMLSGPGPQVSTTKLITAVLTSKPIEPTPSTLKADLVACVNSNMLIMNIIGKNAQWLCVSSTSASKFEFLELPIGTGTRVTHNLKLNSRVKRIYKFIYHALTFIVDAHSNLYARNINEYNTGIYLQIVCYPCLWGAREI